MGLWAESSFISITPSDVVVTFCVGAVAGEITWSVLAVIGAIVGG